VTRRAVCALRWHSVVARRSSLSPATRLLLASAAAQPSATAARLPLQEGVDWDELCALTHRERAASALLPLLKPFESELPETGYRHLREQATLSVMRLLHLEQLLNEVHDTLTKRGIDLALLKGAGLAYSVFRSFAERPMGDLDILVRQEQTEEAWRILQTDGWIWPSDKWGTERYADHQHRPPLIREPGGFRVEIHGDLVAGGHPFRFPSDAVWASAQRVSVGGRSFTVPHVQHQLWHVCVHFAWSHAMQWGTWRALRDCGAIIDRGAVDWAGFIELARASRATTCCFWTLRIAHRLTGAAVPEYVLEALRPPYPERVLELLERHCVLNLFASPNRCPSIWLSRRFWEVCALPRWSGHGSARPWHVGERWSRAAEAVEPREQTRRSFSLPVTRIREGAGYLRRIYGLALPDRRPVTRTGERQ
jgi:hypothetical protein